MVKKQILITLLISFLLVSVTPVLIPDLPILLSQNTYNYEFGFPFPFIEQTVGVITSHGEPLVQNLSQIIFNPFIYFDFSFSF